MKFGIDRLLADPALRAPLQGRRVALLAHPASVTADLAHSLDALAALPDLQPDRRLRPPARPARRQAGQHGREPGLPRSGATASRCSASTARCAGRPTTMMESFDVLLVDLQDLGCRIYTFITTLRYVLEAAAAARQGGLGARPPQPGRPPGRGPAACAPAGRASSAPGRCPMRHGLTLGELGAWFVETLQARRRLPRHRDGGLAARRRARLRLAARRARLDQPQPQRAQPVDGARLCRHGDARGRDPVGGPRHHPPAGAVRRARTSTRAR